MNTSRSAHFATLTAEQTAALQNTNIANGIDSLEAEYRRRLGGSNDLGDTEQESLVDKFVDQFKNPLILLLFGSALVSLLLGQIDDAISITLVSMRNCLNYIVVKGVPCLHHAH